VSAKRPGNPDGEDDSTPATRSYIDALLKGNMSEAEIASLKAEIAANPNARSSVPAPRSSRPAAPPSSAPPSSARPSRPVGPPSSAPPLRGSVPAPPALPPSVRPVYPSAPPLPISLDPFDDDEDQAPTLYRPSSRAPAAIPAPPSSVRLHLPDPPSLDLELGELFGDDLAHAPPPSSTREEIPLSVRGERRSAALDHTYLDALGGPAGVLRLAVPQAQLHELPLGPQAAFVVSCIDGGSSVDDIIDISSLGRLETLRILYDLMQQGVVVVSGR
jgi:hypothetical protein